MATHKADLKDPRTVKALTEEARLQTTPYGKLMVGHHLSYPTGEPISEDVIYARQGPLLGDGTYGKVYMEGAQNECVRAPKIRAVKEINKEFCTKYKVVWLREVEALVILSQAEHRASFVDFYGWYENTDTVFIAMEYFPLGDLSMCLNSIVTEDEVRTIAKQLTYGLKIMHDYSLVHRDINPKNIFIANTAPSWHVKIADFGVSKRASEVTGLWTTQGTLGYMAPEYASFKRNSSDYPTPTSAVDLWSLGCIIYELFTKECPFTEENRTFEKYCDDRILSQALENSFAGDEAQQVIRELLDPRPEFRLSAEDALMMFWFAESTAPESSIYEEISQLDLTPQATEPGQYVQANTHAVRAMASNISLATTATLVNETNSMHESSATRPFPEFAHDLATLSPYWHTPEGLPPYAHVEPSTALPADQPPPLPMRPTKSTDHKPLGQDFKARSASVQSLDGFDEDDALQSDPRLNVFDAQPKTAQVFEDTEDVKHTLPPALPPRRPSEPVNSDVKTTTPESWIDCALLGRELCMSFGPIHGIKDIPQSCDFCDALRSTGRSRPRTAQNQLHVCETCGDRYLCEFCARHTIAMSGDSHEADHFLRKVFPSYSYPFQHFLSSKHFAISSQPGLSQTLGSSWLASDHGFSAPASLQSGRLQTRLLLDVPEGSHKVRVLLRIVFDPKKCSSEAIGSAKKALLRVPTSSYGTIKVGAQAVTAGLHNGKTPPETYLPSGFVEKNIRYDPEQVQTNVVITMGTPIRLERGQSLEVQIRSFYETSTFRTGSPFQWYIDYIGLSRLGDRIQLANAGEINKRQQFLDIQKKRERDRKIDKAMKYGTNALSVATMGTGLARSAQGLVAAHAKKQSYQLARTAMYNTALGSMTPYAHGGGAASDVGLPYHDQHAPMSASAMYANEWETDSQTGFDHASVVGSDHGQERPQMMHYASDPLPVQATFEQFEYAISDHGAEPGEGAATVSYSRWEASG